MDVTITAKIKLLPTDEQSSLMLETGRVFSAACDDLSGVVYNTRCLNQVELHKMVYSKLREVYKLPSQMACNVIRHVIGNYRTLISNGHEWTRIKYKHAVHPLTWNRDYSLLHDCFSVGVLNGRIKLNYDNSGMQQYFTDKLWAFGAAKVVNKHGKWLLHISMTKDFKPLPESEVCNVTGIDFGINFFAASYDSKGKTNMYSGKSVKHKRAQYKNKRKELQKRGTPSSRRRLKSIGQRENRWMQDVNHCVSKALVNNSPKGTLFVVEDLMGIRNSTEKVQLKDRYMQVSWAFYDLRQKLEYKANMNEQLVIAVKPQYTSQTCPKCGHTSKFNRDKKNHIFCCKTCGYKSNDDRIGAMNLHRKGIEYLEAVTGEHVSSV